MRTPEEIIKDIRALLAESEAPTLEAVTVEGWYACLDGTYCRIIWAQSHPIVAARLKRASDREKFESLESELNEAEEVELAERQNKEFRAALSSTRRPLMLKPTRDEFKEILIQMMAVAAVARKRGNFTDAECEALKPEIAKRANEIYTLHAAIEQGDSLPPSSN